jgi:hypothetical protein
MATLGTQDEDKQNKKHNTICVGHHICKQTEIKWIRHEPSYKQLEVKTNWTTCSDSVECIHGCGSN